MRGTGFWLRQQSSRDKQHSLVNVKNLRSRRSEKPEKRQSRRSETDSNESVDASNREYRPSIAGEPSRMGAVQVQPLHCREDLHELLVATRTSL